MDTGSDASVSLLAQWIFGGAVVVLYARDRFNSPQLIRAMTTFWRYWLAWFGYIVAMLALFVLLGGGMTTVDPGNFLRLFGVTDANVDGTLPGPLLSAMLLTSFLPISLPSEKSITRSRNGFSVSETFHTRFAN